MLLYEIINNIFHDPRAGGIGGGAVPGVSSGLTQVECGVERYTVESDAACGSLLLLLAPSAATFLLATVSGVRVWSFVGTPEARYQQKERS